jgi:RNA polymerase sigma factor (sigma-70 family)
MSQQTQFLSLTDAVELYAACSSADPEVQAAGYNALWTYLYPITLHILSDQPNAEAIAQDCAQTALVRIHEHLTECQEPSAFRAWARRIASHAAIDELRRLKRLVRFVDDELEHGESQVPLSSQTRIATSEPAKPDTTKLRQLLAHAPISDRSRRVVVGRYLDDTTDEKLAERESQLSGQAVRPSHIQVTRAKDLIRLREYPPLRAFMEAHEEEHGEE